MDMTESQDAADEVSMLDLLQVMVDHLRVLIAGPLLAFALALGVGFGVTPCYQAIVRFLPPQQQQNSAATMLANLGSSGGLAGGALGSIKNPTDQYVAFLKSNTLQDALITRFDLARRYETPLKSDTRLALTGHVRIVSSKDGLISVEVEDRSPVLAAELANAHVDELQKLLGRLAVTEAQQKRVFLKNNCSKPKKNWCKQKLP
jgi:capsular polysaccharide biosynthesis protein